MFKIILHNFIQFRNVSCLNEHVIVRSRGEIMKFYIFDYWGILEGLSNYSGILISYSQNS